MGLDLSPAPDPATAGMIGVAFGRDQDGYTEPMIVPSIRDRQWKLDDEALFHFHQLAVEGHPGGT